MKSSDLVGYASENGYMLYTSCYNEKKTDRKEHFTPVCYDQNESDYPGSFCDNCGEKIEGEVIINDHDVIFDKETTIDNENALIFKIEGDASEYHHDIERMIKHRMKLELKRVEDIDYEFKEFFNEDRGYQERWTYFTVFYSNL